MSKQKIILFQGDSITDGGRLKENEWDLNHQMGHGYAHIINAQLGLQFPEKHLHFINRGVSGNRIVDLYARLQEDILNLSPHILSILIGVNDMYNEANVGRGTLPRRFKKVLNLMLKDIHEGLPECKVVLCEPFILPVGEARKNFDLWISMIKPVQDIVRNASKEFDTIFIPLQDRFNELCKIREAEYWIWDGVHPTVCGHGVIAHEWIKATRTLL